LGELADTVEFSVLGPLEVRRGGEPLTLGGFKRRAVLAALLLRAGDPVPSDQLLIEVWGAEPPPTAPAALQNAISQLRKTLEPDRERAEPSRLLVTDAAGYRLVVAPDRLDVSRFERLVAEGRGAREGGDSRRAGLVLREALALWRGPALAEFRYEDFAQAAIARLEELRVLAVEERIQADLDGGAGSELVGDLEGLVRAYPLRERLHGLLMLALYRAGRQADALAAYQEARRKLVDELGIEPSPTLHALERKILAHDASLAGPESTTPSTQQAILVVDDAEADHAFLLGLAADLAGTGRPHEILLARTVLEDGVAGSADALARVNRELEGFRRELIDSGIQARAAAFTSRSPGADLARFANLPDVDLVIASGSPALSHDGRFGSPLRELLADAPSDVAVLAGLERADASRPARVLVPFGGGEHDWAALEVAAWLARDGETELRLLGAAADERSSRRDASRLLADAGLLIQRVADVNPVPVLIQPGRKGIVDVTSEHDLLVVGFSDRWREEGLGALRWGLVRSAPSRLLFVRRGLRPGALAPPGSASRFTWSLSRVDPGAGSRHSSSPATG